MKKLNISQKEAVAWKDGPCLVLAGPGSGKTFVLVNRILNLIKTGISPESILTITFTRAAANEMKERFDRLLLDEGIKIFGEPTFGTFHSIFYGILKNNFGYKSDSLLDESDEKRIIFGVIEKRNDINVSYETVNNIISDITSYKMSVEKNEDFTPKYFSKDTFHDIYKNYNEWLFNEKKLDFFDMVSKCTELLQKHDDVLKLYRNRYKYFLIDEFQDINKSQYDIVKLLCDTDNIFAVGDDDQSIYKFRGSQPRVMKDFLKDYKKAHIIKLNENYRCAKVIVKYAKNVIDNNVDRFKKDLIALRDDVGIFELKAFDDSKTESEYIVDRIRYYNAIGIGYSEMAILYRTNLLSSAIVKVLSNYNIPFTLKSKSIGIYDNFAVRDIIAYLSIASGSKNSSDYMLIANKPLRYISRDAIGYKNTSIDSILSYYFNTSFICKKLIKFKHDINVLKKTITPLAIRYIRNNIEYDKYLYEYCKNKKIDYEEEIEILNAFEEDSVGHNDIKEYLSYIYESHNSSVQCEGNDKVSLMTFHLSKGLEYKIVFVIDANDKIVPHRKSINDNDIETERRLFYVAMTRAKDYLHIFFTKTRFGKNYKASRFIYEAVGGKNG